MGFEGDQVHLKESFVEEMREKINRSMFHSYLNKYIQVPSLDPDKFYILLSVLKSKNLPIEKMESIAKTVVYIQAALDTHDLVKNDSEVLKTNLTEQKEQQLTVLAGDYYSGLYYRTLSHLPEISLIKQLASAIKIINEQKIRVYKVEVESLEDFLTSMQQIETILYQKLASYYQLSDYEIISTNWLYVNQIFKWKDKYIDYIVNNNLLNITKANVDLKYLVEERLNQYIKELYHQLPKYIKNESLLNKFKNMNKYYSERFEPPIVR